MGIGKQNIPNVGVEMGVPSEGVGVVVGVGLVVGLDGGGEASGGVDRYFFGRGVANESMG